MNIIMGTADVKARLSEFISRVRHGDERIIIARRGKPVAALVSVEDLHRLQNLESGTEEVELIEKDGLLMLSSSTEISLEDVVQFDREHRIAQFIEQAGL
jgi:prevent-host-death family protein